MAQESERMCLLVASILGDLRTEIVIVGGLVPYLTVNAKLADEPHIGTRDLDLGLSLAFLRNEQYKEVSARLREHGFGPAKNDSGNLTRQRWEHPNHRVTIDFLIPPPPGESAPRPGSLQGLERDFAALVAEALPLAFLDHEDVTLEGRTSFGDQVRQTIRVCGPAAFVALKALALQGRRKNKDAYDLIYLLQHHRKSIATIADSLRLLATEHGSASKALSLLEHAFETVNATGPFRYAAFFGQQDSDELRAEAFAVVQELLRHARRGVAP